MSILEKGKRVTQFFIIFVFLWHFFSQAQIPEKLIIIIVPSYNNIQFYEKNLDSIRNQPYDNYRVVYVDDCSTDGTAQAVEAYIKKWNLENTICLIKNTERRGAMYNHYMATHSCPPHAIVVTLDGDDWFPDSTHVLAYINEVYQDPQVWMTYGQFQQYPSDQRGWCADIPNYIKQLHAYRDYSWVTSHLRTYYAGLFHAIPIGYFMRNGSFLNSTSDVAIMLALLELSGGKALCIQDILYMYNTTNENSDFRIRFLEQISNDYWIRSRTRLTPFTDRSWEYEKSVECESVYNVHISLQSVEACAEYLKTTSHIDVPKNNIQIWYRPSSQEEHNTYQALAMHYDMQAKPIEPHSNFKMHMQTFLEGLAIDSYILITHDGCRWLTTWSSVACIDMLIKTKAASYSCVRGVDTQVDTALISPDDIPAFVSITDSFYVWKYSEESGHWHIPCYFDGVMIKASQLQAMIGRVKGATPEQLFYNLSLLAANNIDDVGLCSCVAPCKMVGTDGAGIC
jgi:glycosyltransferase involved in cell wall biosynthesis